MCNQYYADNAGKTPISISDIVIPATGHTEEVIPGSPATYYEAGLTDGIRCSVCGTVIKEQEIVPQIIKDSYTIQYMNTMVPSTDTRYYLQNDIVDHFNYNVGVEKALPTPQLDKYTFIGWSDADG